MRQILFLFYHMKRKSRPTFLCHFRVFDWLILTTTLSLVKSQIEHSWFYTIKVKTSCLDNFSHYVRVWYRFCLLFLTQLLSTRHGFALSLMELTYTEALFLFSFCFNINLHCCEKCGSRASSPPHRHANAGKNDTRVLQFLADRRAHSIFAIKG